MAYKIVIKEEAKLDTEEAYNYYENEKANLGEEFLEELTRIYNRIAKHPDYYGFIDDQRILRDLKVERFPFTVVFEITDSSVIVYAVHNTYRHPKRKLRR